MKVIDLLNKIANGEEVPKKIKYKGHIYQYQYKDTKEANIINYYYSEETHRHLIDGGNHDIRLNDEVEILEEEKKIPEKLKIEQDGQTYNNFYIVNQNGTKCYLTKHSKMIVETLNQVIDYLKSKGDE